MTQEEFFAYANLDNHSGDVNVWYSGSNPSTILGLSVPVLTLNNGVTTNITPQLAQVQQITIPQPSGYQIIVEVTARSVNESPHGTRYYLFLVNQISTTGITGDSAPGGIYLSPDINIYEFSVSPYNVLGGSVEENRESNYIMRADKDTSGGINVPIGYSGPANIYALLSGSAEKAIIQDSNYSLTGWNNARYRGTKTDKYDYQSPPLLSGTTFQGSNYPATVPPAHIQSEMSDNTAIYSNYFYDGTEETPGYSTKVLLYNTSGSSTNGNTLWLKTTTSNSITGAISPGDLITVGFPISSNTEVMRVGIIGIPPGYAPGTVTVSVTRNVNNVPTLTDIRIPNLTVSKIKSVQIYEVEGNRLNGIVRGYMAVRITGEILKLDNNGFVLGKVE